MPLCSRTASDGQQSDMRGIGGMGPGRVATQTRHFPLQGWERGRSVPNPNQPTSDSYTSKE